MAPKLQTFGWCATRDLTNQCATPCKWLLIQGGMACCEFDKPCFPHATNCERFDEVDDGTV